VGISIQPALKMEGLREIIETFSSLGNHAKFLERLITVLAFLVKGNRGIMP
jgi:hypothetical protein